MKLYYNCEDISENFYKTSYMANMFDVIFIGLGKRAFYLFEGYEVHPDSYHIFEPQEGDKNIDGYVFDAKLQVWKKFTVMTPLDEGVYNMKLPHELPISERNGKAFITPERE